MSAQTFTCFSDLPQELQLRIWRHAIEVASDDAWNNEHGSQSVRIPDGNIIWRRGIIGPISGRKLRGLQDYGGIIRSCALARKLCFQHHKRSVVHFMASCKKTQHLSQAAKEAALQRNGDPNRDLDELIRLLDVASGGSARPTVSPDCLRLTRSAIDSQSA